MKRVLCSDCGRTKEPCRPVVRLVSGTILFVCHACWKRYDYDRYMYAELSAADRAALRGY